MKALIVLLFMLVVALSLVEWQRSRAETSDTLKWWNELDVSSKYGEAAIELRQKLAPEMQKFFPHEGCCHHCGWPWSLVTHHIVQTSENSGKFLFCSVCWDHLLAYGKVREIEEAYAQAALEDIQAYEQFGAKLPPGTSPENYVSAVHADIQQYFKPKQFVVPVEEKTK